MENRVPIRKGTFVEDEDGKGVRLLANRCISCGQIFFPKVNFCLSCLNKKMEDVFLSRYGKLYSYTIGRMAAAKFLPPYFVGLVDMPEGVRIFAPIKATEDQTIEIGMDMEVVIDELWKEGDKQVIGYKFRPL